MSRPPSRENEEVEPVQSVQMNIYQSNTYWKDLNWLPSSGGEFGQQNNFDHLIC